VLMGRAPFGAPEAASSCAAPAELLAGATAGRWLDMAVSALIVPYMPGSVVESVTGYAGPVSC
jgi:hypothetical protein